MEQLEIKLGCQTLHIEKVNSNGNIEIMIHENGKCESLIYLSKEEAAEVLKFLAKQL